MILLRAVTDDDWAQWRAVRLSALAEAPYAFSSTLAEWTGAQDSERRWRQRLVTVPFNLLAFVGSEAIGMASATAREGDEVELISMWVAPVVRGKGVGDALIAQIAAWAHRQGASRLVLEVRHENDRAEALYVRNGFAEEGRSARADQEPQEPKELGMVGMVRMVRKLP